MRGHGWALLGGHVGERFPEEVMFDQKPGEEARGCVPG